MDPTKLGQGKVAQALEELFYTGSGRSFWMITSDQPKGLPGLTSRAEDKGTGKVNVNHRRLPNSVD